MDSFGALKKVYKITKPVYILYEIENGQNDKDPITITCRLSQLFACTLWF